MALCYAELANRVPASGSSYSFAYATVGEFAAFIVAACLLLEYGLAASWLPSCAKRPPRTPYIAGRGAVPDSQDDLVGQVALAVSHRLEPSMQGTAAEAHYARQYR